MGLYGFIAAILMLFCGSFMGFYINKPGTKLGNGCPKTGSATTSKAELQSGVVAEIQLGRFLELQGILKLWPRDGWHILHIPWGSLGDGHESIN